MIMKYLRIIGPKRPKDDAPAAKPEGSPAAEAEAESPPESPAGPETPTPTPIVDHPLRGGVNYLTNDPAHCKTPQEPDLSRALAPHSVAEVYDYIDAFQDRTGLAPDAQQLQAIVGQAEAWLEKKDQEFMDYIEGMLEDLLPEPEPPGAAPAAE